ncbi:MAG: hypothetical protein K0S01_176 [Herbinix sp.]|jgi:methyl-accepting chemotaxis protein|nr:hypothetical protein [Herbinix sp.]
MKKSRSRKNSKRVLVFNEIKYKLIVSFLIPVVLMLLLGIICYLKASTGMIQKYETTAQTSMTMTAKYFDTLLSTIESKALQFDTDSIVSKYFTGKYEFDMIEQKKRKEEITSKILSITLSEKSIANIYVFSKNGLGLSSNGELATSLYDEFLASTDVAKVKAEEKVWLGAHPALDQLTKSNPDKYCISLIKRLHDQNNLPIGYIVIDVDYDFVKEALSEIQIDKESRMGFVSSDQREVTVSWLSDKKEQDFSFTKQSFFGKAVGAEFSDYVTMKGEEDLFLMTRIESAEVLICALIPKAVILEQSAGMKYIIIMFVLVASSIAIVTGLIMASGIGNTINKINGVLERVTKGELNLCVSTKRKDEFGTLSDSITNMIMGMKELVIKMSKVSIDVNHSSKDVVQSSDTLIQVSDRIAEASNDIEQGMAQQAQDTQDCLMQMEYLSSKIQTMKEHVGEIEKSAKNTEDISQIGLDMTGQLKNKSSATSQITEDIVTDMKELEEQSKHITEFVELINGIAEQTNLLSLNASIESARAGEYGKGFGVVAVEIRKLAEKSTNTANHINKLAGSIRNQSAKTLDTAQKAKGVVKEQDELLFETIKVFGIIREAVKTLLEELNQISKSIIDINVAKRDALESIESISAAAQETAANTTGLTDTISRQMNVVETLKQAVNHLNENAIELDNAIKIFQY